MVVKSSKAASKKKVVKQLIPSFDMGSLYESILKKVEKQRNISPFVTPLVRISSGRVATEIITGGGIPTGRYTQWSGPEAGGKSTNAMTFAVSCAKHGIAMNKYHDAESAVTESLFKNIARHAGIKDHTDLFGVEGEGGAWLKPPIVRLYKESSAEAVLLALKDVYQRLPSKVFKKSDNTWYYAFADSKNALKTIQACGLGKPSDILYKQTGMYWCPAPDGDKPQAVSCLDSWPALLPPSFLSQDKDPSKQRAQIAAFISLYLSPIIGELASKHIIFTGINQVRANPNANFGCFAYTTQVLMADGSTELIGNLVSQPGREVMSYNKATGKLEAKPIVKGFDNGESASGEFTRVTFDLLVSGHTSHVKLTVTKGHKVLTPSGEVSIGELSVGAIVLGNDNDIVKEIKIIGIEPIRVSLQKYDLEIEGNHTYIVGANNGIIVHNSPEYEPCGNALKFNSSIRNQNRPRGYEGNGGKPVAVEASVEDNNQEDTYHYKLLKNTKNKTASPLLETWSRIWVSDYEGLGRGYDPVIDTYIYLKDTNQIVKGNKNKFTIKMGGQNDREYTWMDFKRAVIAEVTVSSAIRKKLMQELKLDKLPTIRKECFKQVKDGKGLEMFCLSKKIDPEAVSDDDDD